MLKDIHVEDLIAVPDSIRDPEHDLDLVAPLVEALALFHGLVPGFPARNAGCDPLRL